MGKSALGEELSTEDMKSLAKRRHMESVVIESYATERQISLIGIHFDQFITNKIYTGLSTYIAIRGKNNVGGYGLLGTKIGIQQNITRWLVYNGQLIIGGAGGGGVLTGGGLVLRFDSGLGINISKSVMLKFSAGYLKSYSGGTFKTPLYSFGISISSFNLYLPIK